MARRPIPPARGAMLIELMIAMAVLAVGMLAMWHLHMVGLTSTAAGRRNTIATALASELLSGLERLSYDDALLSSTATGRPASDGSPTAGTFGYLVDASGAVAAGARAWDDAAPVPGVRLDSEMREASDASARYQRRWTVWAFVAPLDTRPTPTPGAKMIAASVVWWDPPFARPREVVLYSQVPNPAAIRQGLEESR